MLVFIIAFSSCATLLATGIQLWVDYRFELGEQEERVHQTAEAYLPRLTLAVHRNADTTAYELIEEVLQVSEASGVELLGSRPRSVGNLATRRDDVLSYRYSLNYDSNGEFVPLGALRIEVPRSAVFQRIEDKILIILITQGIKTFFVSIFILLVFRSIVTRHLRRMGNYARRLDLDHLDEVLYLSRGHRNSADELDEVAAALNEMRLNLRQGIQARERAERRLKKLNESLEQQVAERTADLIDALEQAKEASNAKSRFLGTMSHEIRTPLNGILGLSQALLEEDFTEEQRLWVRTILRSGEVLLALVNDLLDLSMVESGELKLQRKPVNIGAILDEVRQMHLADANRKGISLEILHEGGSPALQIEADPQRVRQIVSNFLSNAIKFTDHGSIKLVSNIEPFQESAKSEPRARLLVSVHDTGIGVPPERSDAIFEAFTQGDGSTTRRHGGSGLGLALCKVMAELMGGSVGVTAGEDGGSVFFLDLTRRIAPPERDGTTSEQELARIDG